MDECTYRAPHSLSWPSTGTHPVRGDKPMRLLLRQSRADGSPEVQRVWRLEGKMGVCMAGKGGHPSSPTPGSLLNKDHGTRPVQTWTTEPVSSPPLLPQTGILPETRIHYLPLEVRFITWRQPPVLNTPQKRGSSFFAGLCQPSDSDPHP